MATARKQTVTEFENELEEMANGRPLNVGIEQSSDLSVNAIVNDKDTRVVYDRRTGEPSRVKAYEGNDTLQNMLQKVDSDPNSKHYGKRIFTLNSPEQRPELFYEIKVKGSTPCILNENHPRFAEFRAMGFGTCPRGDLPNEQEADRHAKVAHMRAYPAIKELDEKRAAQEQRDTMNALLAALVKKD